MSMSAGPKERRGPGRPRKWATDAERARAYRERKAAEHSDVDELRLERRVLKRQLSDAVRGRTRAEAATKRAEARANALEAELARAERDLEWAQTEARYLSDSLARYSEAKPAEASAAPPPQTAGLSRQQRRAMERSQRRHKQ